MARSSGSICRPRGRSAWRSTRTREDADRRPARASRSLWRWSTVARQAAGELVTRAWSRPASRSRPWSSRRYGSSGECRRSRAQMSLKTWGGYTFDAVRQAVQHRQGWSEDRDADGRERWCGPCPIFRMRGAAVFRQATSTWATRKRCSWRATLAARRDPGHLGGKLFREHLDALGVTSNGSRS